MQSCVFGLIIILFILIKAFSILIVSLKKIPWQTMLMLQTNKKYLISCFYFFLLRSYLYHIWLFPRLLRLSGDIKKNPGPETDYSQTFSIIGHWNLNSLVAYNFTKSSILKAYLSVQRFDTFCISETCLNSVCEYLDVN